MNSVSPFGIYKNSKSEALEKSLRNGKNWIILDFNQGGKVLGSYEKSLLFKHYEQIEDIRICFQKTYKKFVSYYEIFQNFDIESENSFRQSLKRVLSRAKDFKEMLTKSDTKPIDIITIEDSQKDKKNSSNKPLDKEAIKRIWAEKQKEGKIKERKKRGIMKRKSEYTKDRQKGKGSDNLYSHPDIVNHFSISVWPLE